MFWDGQFSKSIELRDRYVVNGGVVEMTLDFETWHKMPAVHLLPGKAPKP